MYLVLYKANEYYYNIMEIFSLEKCTKFIFSL